MTSTPPTERDPHRDLSRFELRSEVIVTNKYGDVMHGTVRHTLIGRVVVTALGQISQHLLDTMGRPQWDREGGPQWRVYSTDEWAQRGVPQT